MRIHYTIRMDEPETHYFRVAMRIEGLAGTAPEGRVTLAMPVWTPGSYLVREFARNVLELEASDGSGAALRAEKDDKDSWVVSTGGAEAIEVGYRVYAFRHDTNQSYLDGDHAVVNGASVFLYLQGHQDHPLTLEVVPHEGWKVISTGLETKAGGVDGSRTFSAPSYDILVDSPIEVGNQSVHSFAVRGVTHEVSIFARKRVDEERLVSDIERIVEHSIPVFDDVPYSRYVFLVDYTDHGSGGLEHLNSTHCITSYYQMDPPGEYRKMLSLFSHEFFHAWNVKRMRPMALGPFDYSRENYTRSLWIAEGITSYYDNHILRRAGIFSVPEFFDAFCDEVNLIRSLPSSRWQTPEESSFDTWIRFYREDENTPNVNASYYRQGAVLGTLLDLEIRRATGSASTLDDAMRKVYRETYKEKGRGYTDEEFERACSAVSLGETDEIFAKHVRGREEVDFQRYLGYAGLALEPRSPQATSEGFLGVRVKASPGVMVVSRLFGSPAEAADVSAGDEIIALDGLRMDAQKLPFYVAVQKPGTEVVLTSSREGVLRETKVRLAARVPLEFRIVKRNEATDGEKAVFRSWLGSAWDEPLVYPERRASPVRVSRLDYV
jgi:predicted metalloprotease with PDZ domain